MDRVAAIVIAADPGVDPQVPKQLLDWNGRPLLDAVVAEVSSWPVEAVLVVLGGESDLILEHTDLTGALLIINPEWEEGYASSLRVAVDTVVRLGGFEELVLTRGDMPGVGPEVVERLIAARTLAGVAAAVPKYRYARGEPIVIGNELWPRLLGLEGDTDVNRILEPHPDWVVEEWFDRLPPHRIHGPEDLTEIRRSH